MRFLGRKLLQLLPVLLAVSALTFLLINLLPGDPAITILGVNATEENVARVRRELELDKPLPTRFATWLGDAATGDLGRSYRDNQLVVEKIGERLPRSLQLMAYAQVLSLAIAIPLGILTAYRAGTLVDRAASTTAFGLLSIPNFMLGVVLVYVFAINLNLFPATGYKSIGEDGLNEHFTSMLLPALTLALAQIAVYMRLLRTDMIATLQEDFVTMARAKGMPTWRILLRHALRPSSLSLITIAGVNVGTLIGGAVIVEQLFALAGMGSLLVQAILARDYLVVQGIVLVVATAYVLINFAVDMLYAVLDPRIRHARALA